MRNLPVLGIALVGAALPALAVEGALGRTLPGVWIQPQAGVVGPSAGFSFTMMPIGYTLMGLLVAIRLLISWRRGSAGAAGPAQH